MQSKKVIFDEPHVWNASLRPSNMVIQLSKTSNQQIFLVGKDASQLSRYFQKINENEIRAIDLVSNIAPYTRFGAIDLLLLNLN